ncbi:MAG: fructosamine kinase family protein [Phycisphaerales bacterium JB039]
MLDPRASEAIASALGAPAREVRPLGGGCVGEVYRAEVGAERIVIKIDRSRTPRLDVEGRMLRYLAERTRLPVPGVLVSQPDLLVMQWIESSRADAGADRHGAELVAGLHGISAARFGLEFDTLIGGLHQPNAPEASWPTFFAERRLREMARQGREAGRLPERTSRRIEEAARRTAHWLGHEPRPSLIHGDLWGGNVLAAPGRICGLIDPAIYYADAEVELAFISLFGGFGPAFWERYHELRPIDPAFFKLRRDVYNLYPLLVHVRLFGGGYLGQLEGLLSRLGV